MDMQLSMVALVDVGNTWIGKAKSLELGTTRKETGNQWACFWVCVCACACACVCVCACVGGGLRACVRVGFETNWRLRVTVTVRLNCSITVSLSSDARSTQLTTNEVSCV